MSTSHLDSALALDALLRVVADERHGFYVDADIERLVRLDPLRLVLVRHGNGRVLAPAQAVLPLCRLIQAGGGYIRDLSIPAFDPIYVGRRNS